MDDKKNRYTEKDAQKDTGSSKEEVHKAWHYAREDSQKSQGSQSSQGPQGSQGSDKK